MKRYRPDIDGLRAIAVFAVLIHHLNADLLPGGFAGVDVFFVISGYLITSQVHSEVLNGKFSFLEFYKRRVNRIIPALAFVLFVSTIAGWFILTPVAFNKHVVTAVTAILGISNLYLWREFGNYFADLSSEIPLLHTWSLGVEEQFYLVWPMILFACLKFPRRIGASLLVIAAIIALAASALMVEITSAAAYFLLPSRFYELLIGAILAIFLSQNNRGREVPGLNSMVGVIGLGLLTFSFFYLNKSSSFPGFNALCPTIGAAAIIFAGRQGDAFPSRTLSMRPFVFIGLISYSLYLWHWPIIAYLNYLDIRLSLPVAIFVIVVSFALALFSWKFVEIPLRISGAQAKTSTVLGWRFGFTSVLFALIATCSLINSGFATRFDRIVIEREAMLESKPNELRAGCHVASTRYLIAPNDSCRLGERNGKVDGMLIGDSFANHFTAMIDVFAEQERVSFIDYTMDGCPPLLNYDISRGGGYAKRCRERNRIAFSYIERERFEYVVLAGDWPDTVQAGRAFADTIEFLKRIGSKIIVVEGNSRIRRAARCPLREMTWKPSLDCSGIEDSIPRYIEELHGSNRTINLIRPNSVLCHYRICSPILDNVLVYRDDGHLNAVGSRAIGMALVRRGVRLTVDDR